MSDYEAQVMAGLKGLAALSDHPKASAVLAFSADLCGNENVSASFYTDGLLGRYSMHATGATALGAIINVKNKYLAGAAKRDEKATHRMAISIIEITGTTGSCHASDLMAWDFTPREIDCLHVAACEHANKLTANAAGGYAVIF